MAVLAPFVFWQSFDNDGDPLAGGQIETYEAGTLVAKRTFVDADETAENTNPIILDANGRASIWLDEGPYKFILKDSTGALVDEVNDFSGDAAGAIVSYDITSNLNLTSIYDNASLYCTGTFNINLLPAVDAEDGFQFRVYNEGAGIVTIDPNSSETINGAATLAVQAGTWAQVYCTGAEWFALSVGTLALQNANAVDIDGGTIDEVTLGTSSAVTEAQIDNININGNTISSTDTDGDLIVSPNGSGVVNVDTSLISNVADPVGAQDAATKGYVDGKVLTFTSSNQVITSAGGIAIAHGLGGVPDFAWILLECTTAENGFSIGDVIVANTSIDDNSGASLALESANLVVRYASPAEVFGYSNKSTGGTVRLTNTNWEAIFKAIRYV